MLGPSAPGSSPKGGFNDALIPRLFESILSRTRQVLAEEAGIAVRDVTLATHGVDKVHLHQLTVLAGLGAPVNVLIAFSFAETLLEGLFEGMASALDLDMDDADTYRGECAAEAVNMALGLGTADLQSEDITISLSPPVILNNTQSIYRHRKAFFASMHLTTDKGALDVNVVGPLELFDERMNYTL